MAGSTTAALKRWRKRGERERMSRLMKARYRPKLTIGVTPQRTLPPQIATLLDAFGDEAIEVVNCEPVRVGKHRCWSVAVTDGNALALAERYSLYVRENGLDLYRLFRKPLPQGDGLSIVLFVGIPKGA